MKFDITKKTIAYKGGHLIFRNVIVFAFTSTKSINNVWTIYVASNKIYWIWKTRLRLWIYMRWNSGNPATSYFFHNSLYFLQHVWIVRKQIVTYIHFWNLWSEVSWNVSSETESVQVLEGKQTVKWRIFHVLLSKQKGLNPKKTIRNH